ncbi:unnamed protein product [Moneuplotes crassus]|uniref:Uncharacterized protein n=1 Tax=Euplotes crassus TaxID=5936 RepID=A0AAD1UN89_EUPCR|nr:unnamed protein product [Moneuplotes crassus]
MLLEFVNTPDRGETEGSPPHKTQDLSDNFVKKIVKGHFLMRGMEQEKYLKPHFSKVLNPLINFLFNNSEFYNIPSEIKEDKSGPFKFPEYILNPSEAKSKLPNSIQDHLGDNKTARKLKEAIKSAKKSKRRQNRSNEYNTRRNISQNTAMSKNRSITNEDYDLIYSSAFEPRFSSICKDSDTNFPSRYKPTRPVRPKTNKSFNPANSSHNFLHNSAKKRIILKKDSAKFYRTKGSIYQTPNLRESDEFSLEKTSEFISTLSRPFIGEREKSANCVNRRNKDGLYKERDKGRMKGSLVNKKRNIRTARPASKAKFRNNKGHIDQFDMDTFCIAESDYPN